MAGRMTVQGACGRRATWRIRRAAGNVAAQEKVGQELFSTFLRFAFGFWYDGTNLSANFVPAELG
jgi:hypothetical protein